ncbi:MAG: FHA domain-containing protein [bacterium]
MRDGMTEKKNRTPSSVENALPIWERFRPSLVVVEGSHAGATLELNPARALIGRGPGVDAEVPDPAMSRQHFVIEAAEDRWVLRDLQSTNGVMVNGKRVDSVSLKHGDRVRAGDHEFQFLLEKVEREPRTFRIDE